MQDFREQLKKAMLARDEKTRNILRLLISEIERQPVVPNPNPQATTLRVIRKLIEGNKETLAALPTGDARIPPLEWENDFLGKLMPATLSVQEIATHLMCVEDMIKSAKSDGQAMGVAMKYLKNRGEVLGDDVQAAVKILRAT
jgi:uncharacterized protein YqeY